MLYSNTEPRYLPHLDEPEILHMGLSPMGDAPWIETDDHIARYHEHKLRQRGLASEDCYGSSESSLDAQRELADELLAYLVGQQPDNYRVEGDQLYCIPGDFHVAIASDEPLWTTSLWVADDLVLMERVGAEYCLTAASLCSPSHWSLTEKFGRPMREIHDPIPGFHSKLTPKIDRFFDHLRPSHPVVRYNWALDIDDNLAQRPRQAWQVDEETPLYYRSERQSLVRLPESGAIAFSIRVYVHPLASLRRVDGALQKLLDAVDAAPEPLQRYKGFPDLAPALRKYRT